MRLEHAAIAVPLVVFSCAPAPPAHTTSTAFRAPPRSAAERSSVVPPPTIVSANQPLEPPLPKAPPGVDPEQVAIAASICRASLQGVVVGCVGDEPNGILDTTEVAPERLCAIEKVIHGSFTRAGANEALVGFSFCLPPDKPIMPYGQYGSAVVVEAAGSRWRRVVTEYNLDLRSDESGSCVPHRRADGRTMLLCHTLWPPAMKVLFSVDFQRAVPRKTMLGWLYAYNPDVTCPDASQPDLPLPHDFTWARTSLAFRSFELADINADGKPDLVVRVRRASVPSSRSFEATLRRRCARGIKTVSTSSLLPRPIDVQLEFLNHDDTFAPSPSTRKRMETWNAEEQGEWGGFAAQFPVEIGQSF